MGNNEADKKGGYQYYSSPTLPLPTQTFSGMNDVTLRKTPDGFGFIMIPETKGNIGAAIKDVLPALKLISSTQGPPKPGDIIVEINDLNISSLPHDTILSILRSIPVNSQTLLRLRSNSSNFNPATSHNSNTISMSGPGGNYMHNAAPQNPNGMQSGPYLQQQQQQQQQHLGYANMHQQMQHMSIQPQQQQPPTYNVNQPAANNASSANLTADFNMKVESITAMGFEKEAVTRVLLSLNGDIDATIAALVSESSQAASGQGPPVQPNQNQPAQSGNADTGKKKGFLGFFQGSSK